MTDQLPDEHDSYLSRLRHDAVRGSFWTAAASVIGLPFTFAANVIVARSLGPQNLGRLATYIAAFSIVGIFTNFGWSEATVQWLAAATARDEAEERLRLISKCAGFHILVAGSAQALCAFVLIGPSNLAFALIGAALSFVTQALATSTVVLTASARNAMSAQIALGMTTATQLGFMATAAVTRAAVPTWIALLVANTITAVVAASVLRRDERRALFHPEIRVWHGIQSQFVKYSASACGAALVGVLVFGRSEIFVLRANGLLRAAGVFAVITGLASQLTGPLDSLLGPLTPMAAGLVATGKPRARRIFLRTTRLSAFLGTAAACALVPMAILLLEPLYGRSFVTGRAPLLFLGLVSCGATVIGPIRAFAFATRSAAAVLRANVTCLAVDALLAVSLVPALGLWGAVVANGVAQILSFVLLTRIVSRKLDVSVGLFLRETRLFWLATIVGTGEGTACVLLARSNVLYAILPIVVGTVLIWVTVTLLSELRIPREDFDFFAAAMHRSVRPAFSALERLRLVRSHR